jgi:hypothetical protein
LTIIIDKSPWKDLSPFTAETQIMLFFCLLKKIEQTRLLLIYHKEKKILSFSLKLSPVVLNEPLEVDE